MPDVGYNSSAIGALQQARKSKFRHSRKMFSPQNEYRKFRGTYSTKIIPQTYFVFNTIMSTLIKCFNPKRTKNGTTWNHGSRQFEAFYDLKDSFYLFKDVLKFRVPQSRWSVVDKKSPGHLRLKWRRSKYSPAFLTFLPCGTPKTSLMSHGAPAQNN